MVPAKKTQPVTGYTQEQRDRAFALASHAWAGPYIETLLSDPKAMRNLAKRCIEFVVIFDEVAS